MRHLLLIFSALLVALPAFGQARWPADKVIFDDTDDLQTKFDAGDLGGGSIDVNGSTVASPNFADTVAVQIVECTGAGTPNALCQADDDIIGIIPHEYSHYHYASDIKPPHYCIDVYNSGGPPQDSGIPDGKCDVDGTTLATYICADNYDTPLPAVLGGSDVAQTSCSNTALTTCPDGFCDSVIPFGRIRSRSLPRELYAGTYDQYFVQDAALVAPHWVQMKVLDGKSGSVQGYKIELDVEDLDVNDATDEVTDPNATSMAILASVTPSSVNFPYPNIIVARNETLDTIAPVGAAFRHYVTKHGGSTEIAFDGSHGKINYALAIGPNKISTECEDLYDTGGPPQNSCTGGIQNYDDIKGCPDTYCDIDGTTTAPDLESFTATDVEAVMLGASVDDADAQHSHGSLIGSSGVTYENLSANSDIGFGAAQVPQGSAVCQSDGTSCAAASEIASGTAPTVSGTGDIGVDTSANGATTGQLVFWDGTAAQTLVNIHQHCVTVESLVDGDDGKPIFANTAYSSVLVVSAMCSCIGTCTTEGIIDFQNQQTGTPANLSGNVYCETPTEVPTVTSLGGVAATLDQTEVLTFNNGQTSTTADDDYLICINYKVVRQ